MAIHARYELDLSRCHEASPLEKRWARESLSRYDPPGHESFSGPGRRARFAPTRKPRLESGPWPPSTPSPSARADLSSRCDTGGAVAEVYWPRQTVTWVLWRSVVATTVAVLHAVQQPAWKIAYAGGCQPRFTDEE